MKPDGKGELFGELYVRSTMPFLAPDVTQAEVGFLERSFACVPDGPVIDLGCGHGRHAAPLAARLSRPVLGIDRDWYSLEHRLRGFHALRGDFFHLPLRDGALAGAFAWYSTLFVFEDEQQLPLFCEIARAVRPGGRLVLQTVPYERVAKEPYARWDGPLPDGSHLFEESHFNPQRGRDEAFRRLTTPDGRVLSAHFFIRYYPLADLLGLLQAAGFALAFVRGGVNDEPLNATSTDLILGVDRKDG